MNCEEMQKQISSRLRTVRGGVENYWHKAFCRQSVEVFTVDLLHIQEKWEEAEIFKSVSAKPMLEAMLYSIQKVSSPILFDVWCCFIIRTRERGGVIDLLQSIVQENVFDQLKNTGG